MNNKGDSLIIFDPGNRVKKIEENKSTKFKFLNMFKRGPTSFKKSEYQLLIIRGKIESEEEYNVRYKSQINTNHTL